jgi:hypothetical protein
MAFRHLFNTIENITGQKVNLKFLDGRGLVNIIVDGSKPQVNGCRDYLQERYQQLPEDHPSRQQVDSDGIVEYIVKLCRFHIEQ